MRGKHLLEKLDHIDLKWVKEAENARGTNRALKWCRRIAIGVTAAAVAVCIGFGAFVRTDAFVLWDLSDYMTMNHSLRVNFFILNDHVVTYRLVKQTELQEKQLDTKKGELLQAGDTNVYRYAGRDDLIYLIFESDGQLHLGEFYEIYYHMAYDENLKDSIEDTMWAELFTMEQIERISAVSSLDEIYRTVYGLNSADDIQSVTFKKTNSDNTDRGRSVKVKTVTLRNREDIAEFYEILCSLQVPVGEDWINDASTEKIAQQAEAIAAQDIPRNQIDRVVLVKLKSGYEIEMRYDGMRGILRGVARLRSPLTDEVNDWIVEHAGIEFTYQGYAENPVVTGQTTVTVRPVPNTDSSEEQTSPDPE